MDDIKVSVSKLSDFSIGSSYFENLQKSNNIETMMGYKNKNIYHKYVYNKISLFVNDMRTFQDDDVLGFTIHTPPLNHMIDAI